MYLLASSNAAGRIGQVGYGGSKPARPKSTANRFSIIRRPTSALGMFRSWRASRNRSVTVSTPYLRMYSQLSGRQETIVRVRWATSRSAISPVATSASGRDLGGVGGAAADELVDQRVDLVDREHDGAGQRQQLGDLVDEQPRDLPGGVDAPVAAVLQVDLVAGQVVVADVLVLLQRRRQQDQRPRGVLADQAQRGGGPAQRRDEHLDALGGRRHLPGDLGAEAAVEPDLVRQPGEQRRQLVAAAVGQRQQLLHHRAEDLLPERLREQVADQEEEAALRAAPARGSSRAGGSCRRRAGPG